MTDCITLMTFASGTSPSNGQPKLAAMVKVVFTPAMRAAAAISCHCATDSAMPAPWLRWLKVSLATTT